MTRSCSECSLCCKLLPIKEDAERLLRIRNTIPRMIEAGWAKAEDFRGMLPDFDKPAGERCPHQKHRKGCAIYAQRPFGCRMWNCRWLADAKATANLSRPDRVGYVIDVVPDYITITHNDGSEAPVNIEVIQIWVDAKNPDTHRDPALRAYLEQEKKVALIRLSGEGKAFTLWPPSLSSDAQWHETAATSLGREHDAAETAEALASALEVRAVFGD